MPVLVRYERHCASARVFDFMCLVWLSVLLVCFVHALGDLPNECCGGESSSAVGLLSAEQGNVEQGLLL